MSCADGVPAGSICTLAVGAVPTGGAASAVFAVDVAGVVPAGVLALSNTVSIADDGSGSSETDPLDNSFTLATSMGAAVINGVVWVDLDANGSFEAGEPSLAGATVKLTHLASGTVLARIVAADGTFGFGGLAAGDFRIGVDPATVPVGYTAAAGTVVLVSSGSGSATPALITVGSGQVWEASLPYLGSGTISGAVWSDLDGDGVKDTAEPGLSGVTLQATASGHTWTEITDLAGGYSFINLPPDTYSVDVVAGGPADASVTAGSLPFVVGLAPGIAFDPLNIGYHEIADLALTVNLYDAPNAGAEITYIFTVANNGPAGSGPLSLNALLPGGFDYTAAAGAGWSCALTTQLTCTGSPLAAGGTTTVAITGTVSASDGVTLTILGAITSTTPDSDLGNNQAALSAGVGQLPQTGINADKFGLYGLLLALGGGLMLLWAMLADRRREEEDELPAA